MPLERDGFSSRIHPAPAYSWSMIFSEKPVSTFRDRALGRNVQVGPNAARDIRQAVEVLLAAVEELNDGIGSVCVHAQHLVRDRGLLQALLGGDQSHGDRGGVHS